MSKTDCRAAFLDRAFALYESAGGHRPGHVVLFREGGMLHAFDRDATAVFNAIFPKLRYNANISMLYYSFNYDNMTAIERDRVAHALESRYVLHVVEILA